RDRGSVWERRELTRGTARPGRTTVGLRDVQPAVRLGSYGGHGEIVTVTTPGHKQAEVDGRPNDALLRVGGAELPQLAGGGGELEPEGNVRRGQAARLVPEVPGQHGEA